MKKSIITAAITVMALIGLSAAALVWGKMDPITIISFSGTIIVSYILITVLSNRKGVVPFDELTIHMQLKSYRNSWLFTLFTLGILGNLVQFKVVDIPTQTMFTYVFLAMLASFWISRLYYRKHPEAR